jgi:PAS domain S-box-containing protein
VVSGGAVERRLGSGAGAVLAAFLESVADAIYAVDGKGLVQYVNRAGLDVLGYTIEEELVGRPSHETIHHHHVDGTPFPEDECPLLRPRVTGEVVRVDEDWFIRRDGSFVPVAYSSAPVETDRGRGAVVVFRDITAQRAAQEALVRERAVHASRARIVEATLAERRRLGRDLHDGAQQRLTNVALGIQMATRAVPEGSDERELLEGALAETRAAIADLRDLAAGLHPSVLTHRGLRAALESLTARAPVPVTLEVTDERFAPTVEATAYFVAAEALANVAKHAAASTAHVRVERDGDALAVEIGDDGAGGADPAAGWGLRGLADRVAALEGTLTVGSRPGDGTRVCARLPLSSPAAA